MFDVRNAQSWDGQIEKLQVFGIFLLSDTVEVSYDHSEIVSSIVGLLEKIFDAHIKHLHGLKSFSIDSQFFSHILELDFLNNFRDVLDEIGVILERGTSDHPDIA